MKKSIRFTVILVLLLISFVSASLSKDVVLWSPEEIDSVISHCECNTSSAEILYMSGEAYFLMASGYYEVLIEEYKSTIYDETNAEKLANAVMCGSAVLLKASDLDPSLKPVCFILIAQMQTFVFDFDSARYFLERAQDLGVSDVKGIIESVNEIEKLYNEIFGI